MTNSKMTRRALLTSVMALVLCFAMLTGTTFAWFTDQETSGNNKIIAGNLDIEMYNSLEEFTTDTEITTGTENLFKSVALWEPGAVAYENITVVNKGNLALKYQLAVNFANATKVTAADGKEYTLADILKVEVVDGGFTGTRADAIAKFDDKSKTLANFVEEGQLVNTDEKHAYGLIIYWEPGDSDNNFNVNNMPAADKEAKKLTIDFGITLFATQLAAELDAFGPEYDENAPITDADAWDGSVSEDLDTKEDTTEKTLTISSAADLAAFSKAVNAGTTYEGWTVTLAADIDLLDKAWTPIGSGTDNSNPIPFMGKFDGAGHTIYNLSVSANSQAALFGHIRSGSVSNLNVVNATVNSSHYAAVLVAYGYASVMNCTVDNADVICKTELVGNSYDNGDKAGILLGHVRDCDVYGNTVKNSSLTGYRDLGLIAGYASHENSNPEIYNNELIDCVITLDDTNAYGSASANADPIVGRWGTYDATLIKDNTVTNCQIKKNVTVTDNAGLTAAVAAGATTVKLAAGEYELKGNQVDGLTIIGSGDGVKLSNLTNFAGNGNYGAIWQNVNFENVIFTEKVYTMADGAASKFTNCTFEQGFRGGYSRGVEFDGCTFYDNSEGFAMHFEKVYTTLNVKDCDFVEGTVAFGDNGEGLVTFDNCTFSGVTTRTEYFDAWASCVLNGCTFADGTEIWHEQWENGETVTLNNTTGATIVQK